MKIELVRRCFSRPAMLLCLCVVTGCGNGNLFMSGAKTICIEPSIEVQHISPSKALSSEHFLGVSHVSAIDNVHCVLRHRNNSQFFSIYNCLSDTVVCSFLGKGRGPDEATSAGGARITHEGNAVVDVMTPHSLFSYSIDDLLNGNVCPSRKLPMGGRTFIEAAYRAGHRFLCDVRYDSDRFSFGLFDSDLSACLRKYKIFGKDVNFLDQNEDYLKHIVCVRPDGSKAALLMRYFDSVNILDLDSDRHFTVSIGENRLSRKWFSKVDGTRKFYMDGFACQSFFIGIVSRDTERDFMVRQFSWDGALLGQFILEGNPVSFSLSGDGKRIYAMTSDEKLLVYDIPGS